MFRKSTAALIVAVALSAPLALPAAAGSGFELPRLDFGPVVPAPDPDATRGCVSPSAPLDGTCRTARS